ncbi:hypothetical protein [Glycomyces niveus]|uniref:Uncharacterized protein n=1 Tax=Glycomyces niveus TaxID=2820287 RepID=A0ABS3U845_9ACTN|nr:hypothetical protein [Glycomyces sp. NEAU-S30]MBO3734940.1 hypothetical protein [Glycomyces sp. NEAU-S30]
MDDTTEADVKARITSLVLRTAADGRARFPLPPAESRADHRKGQRGNEKRKRRYFGGNPHAGMSTQIWVTKPILRTRGWTDTAIRDFLPEPERYKTNPHYEGSRRPMSLWSAETVGRIEATPAWQAWLRQSLVRRRLSLDDLRTARDQGFHRRTAAVNAAVNAYQRADARRHRPRGG